MSELSRRPGADPQRRLRHPRDVVALVVGLVLTAVAGGALWRALVGPLDWSVLATAAPLSLVVIGVVGLLLTRRS